MDDPGLLFELASILHSPPDRVTLPNASNLHTALLEVRAWATDTRTIVKAHYVPWQSVQADAVAALATTGPELRRLIPQMSRDRVGKIIPLPLELGRFQWSKGEAMVDRSSSVVQTVDHILSELGKPSAAVAAFDDLVAALRTIRTSWSRVSQRFDVFRTIVGLNARAWATTVDELGDCLDRPKPIEACRDYLGQPTPEIRYEVWFAFTAAKLKGEVDHDGILFVDGPTLVSALTAGSEQYGANVLGLQKDDWWEWPAHAPWVAARVTMKGRFADPVEVAVARVEELVSLARRGSATEWVRKRGHMLYTERTWHRWILHDSRNFDTPHTAIGERLHKMTGKIGQVSPEVLDAITDLQHTSKSPGPVSVLSDVRAIELVSTRLGFAKWYDFMREMETVWVLQAARMEVMNSVDSAAWHSSGPKIVRTIGFQAHTPGFNGWRRPLLYLPALKRMIPRLRVRDPYSRKLREVQSRVHTVEALSSRIDELRSTHRALVLRLARARDAFAHGGPFVKEAFLDIAQFAHRNALTALIMMRDAQARGVQPADLRSHFDDLNADWTFSVALITDAPPGTKPGSVFLNPDAPARPTAPSALPPASPTLPPSTPTN